jgi:uncharacterized membrane protein YgcG
MRFIRSLTLSLAVVLGVLGSHNGFAQQANPQAPIQSAQQTPEQLQQLVAPIGLYPDALVAQILAASTYPAQVVEADRWLQQHPDLKADALGQQVDAQQWDPSVKALTQFPKVLADLDKNITWTSGLGDAYTNQQQDIMNAVQVLRQRAQASGNLNTTSQQTVLTQGSTIVVQPLDPEVIYVPEYNPWVVYGTPLVAYPGWYPFEGLYLSGPGIFFGEGFGMGYFDRFGWGWHNWGYDWHGRRVLYEHNTYISHSTTFINRHDPGHRPVGISRGASFGGGRVDTNRGTVPRTPSVSRGFAQPHNNPGTRSSAFSGFDHGGATRSFSSRGQSSLGGMHGGAGGFHAGGGGGHAGGGRR